MKNLIVNTLFVLLTASSCLAQDGSQDRSQEKTDKIKTLFTAFLTEKLEMTDDESLMFWAAQNELDKAREVIRNEKKELRKSPKENDSLSDKELEENVIKMADLLIAEIELNKAFTLECFNILDPNRATKINVLKKQFRARIKERRSKGKSQSTPRREK